MVEVRDKVYGLLRRRIRVPMQSRRMRHVQQSFTGNRKSPYFFTDIRLYIGDSSPSSFFSSRVESSDERLESSRVIYLSGLESSRVAKNWDSSRTQVESLTWVITTLLLSTMKMNIGKVYLCNNVKGIVLIMLDGALKSLLQTIQSKCFAINRSCNPDGWLAGYPVCWPVF